MNGGWGRGGYQALGVDRMNSFEMIHCSIKQVWSCQRNNQKTNDRLYNSQIKMYKNSNSDQQSTTKKTKD